LEDLLHFVSGLGELGLMFLESCLGGLLRGLSVGDGLADPRFASVQARQHVLPRQLVENDRQEGEDAENPQGLGKVEFDQPLVGEQSERVHERTSKNQKLPTGAVKRRPAGA
jgi:hypothetical protein